MTRFLDINSAYIAANDQQFDSRSRYVRKVADPLNATMTMVTTASLSATRFSSEDAVGWRWQCGTATIHGQVFGGDGYTEPPLTNGPIEIAL